ncbi:MAG: hypothetical protein E6Q66_00565 [Pedobacter sp.]|nr:MAG: hypothetical protein E6Q66_00565 [Pedobacter sp.]
MKDPVSSQPEKKMQLSSVGKLIFPSEVFKEVDPQSLKENLAQLGMSRIDEKTYVQKFPVKGFAIVLSSGKVIEPNTEGNLFLTEDDFKAMARPFQLKIKGTLISAKDYRYSPTDRQITFESTIQDYLAKRMDCHKEESKGHATTSGYKDMGRCMDYNGYSSDGGNYPKNNPKSYTNFVGSDCYFALKRGNCYLDHYRGGCYANHGGQSYSSLIGCPSYYHTHSSSRMGELMGFSY